MKTLLLPMIFLIFSCDTPEEYDCAGVADGDAVEDCAGDCGGLAVVDECGECGGSGPDAGYDCDIIYDIDGNAYETVKIGEQLWMAENLKTTHYNNGDEISYPSDENWGSYDEGQYGVYDNDPSNADIYGNLYNWAVVDDDRGVCLKGWHVPSDEEFMELEIFLGMSEEDCNRDGDNRGFDADVGGKLAGNAVLWNDGDAGSITSLVNNPEFGTSGFNGLPTGARNFLSGYYSNMGNTTHFWSSIEYIWPGTSNNNNAWNRKLTKHQGGVARHSFGKRYGFAIRCLKD